MLKVYDKNGNYIRGIVDYRDARIEQELNITDTLLFRIPKSLGDIFEEEGYIETKEDGRFVIKEKNLTNDGYEIVGKYDLEELLAWVDSKSYITQDIITMGDDLLDGTGWQIKYGDEWGRNLFLYDSYVRTINTYVTSQKVDNYHVKVFHNNPDAAGNFAWSGGWFYIINKYPFKAGEYTISFKTRLIEQGMYEPQYEVRLMKNDSGQLKVMGRESVSSDFRKHSFTFEVSAADQLQVMICLNTNDIEFSDIKLEEGPIATDWTPAPEDLTLPKRTVTGTNMSILELIYKAVDTFKYEIRFDNKSKTIYVADELGSDKGVYFHDEVNLKSLTTTSDTYDFATRLIPVGFNNMGIELINDGKSYVENHTYSDKIITQYWSDERYSIIENLKADAEKRLAKICMPLRSYGAEVRDLSRYAGYKILAYETGDTIELVAKESGIKQKHRIVKKVKYPDEPERDSVVIANRPRFLGEEQEKIVENLRSSFDITRASLELFEDSIQGRVSTVEGTVTELEDGLGEFKEDTEAKITEHTAEFEAISTELASKVSQIEYDENYKEVSDNHTELKQEFDNFKGSIQIGGGDNLIKNSVGYGGTNFWSAKDGVGGTVDSGTSTWILDGVAKHGWKLSGDGTQLNQEVNLLPDTEYTISGRLLKPAQGGGFAINLIAEGMQAYTVIEKIPSETFDGQFSLQFNSDEYTQWRVAIDASADTDTPIELTDLMLAQGQNYGIWGQAAGEIYTLNVRVDGKGINVYSSDGKGQTVMSPDEFAGYYNNQKIFTLNGDITEVMGLYVGGKGLFIPPVKFVQTSSSLDVVWTGR